MRLARVAVDILRPVPVGPLSVETKTLRPGKRVALLETVLLSEGREVLIARGWRIARDADAPVVEAARPADDLPAEATAPHFPGGNTDGYLDEIEWRFADGNFDQPGPCTAWARPRIPLLPGEGIMPMARSLLLADSGSGLSMVIDPRAYIFINVDLTVVLHRDPAGDWLRLEATTFMGGTGTGMAHTGIGDAAGEAGSATQTLLVSPR